MESIITTATVLAMYLNPINGNQQMEQKMEYCYHYDEQGRLADKEMLSWDDSRKVWTKSSRLTYKYYKNGYNVEVSHWNSDKQEYDLPSEVTLYRSQAPNLTTVRTYKMNDTQDNMYLSSSMVLMEPIENSLLAIR